MSLKVSSKKCIKVEHIWVKRDDGSETMTNALKLVEPYTKEDLYNTIAYHLGVLDFLAKKGKEWNEISIMGVFKAIASMDIIRKCVEEYKECEEGKNSIFVRMNKAYDTIKAIHEKSNHCS